jgi:hypothetical protein
MSERRRNAEGLTFQEWMRVARPDAAAFVWDACCAPDELSANEAEYYGLRHDWRSWCRNEDPTEYRE